MTDLYRKACDVKAPHRQPEMSGECDETCFVPVEPDYEAAAHAYIMQTEDTAGKAAKVIVDAALGGTEGANTE